MYHAVEDVILTKREFYNGDHCRWQAPLFYLFDWVALQVFFDAFVCSFQHLILRSYYEIFAYFEIVFQLLASCFIAPSKILEQNAERFRLPTFQSWVHFQINQILCCHGHRRAVSTLWKRLNQTAYNFFSLWHLVLTSIGLFLYACHPSFIWVGLRVFIVIQTNMIGSVISSQRYVPKNVNSMLFYYNAWRIVWTRIVVDLHWKSTAISLKLFAMLSLNHFLFRLFLLCRPLKRTQRKFCECGFSL